MDSRWTWLAAVSLLLAACAPSIRSAARQASGAAVEAGSEELEEEDTQESLARAVQDPEVQQAITAMSEEVADGVLRSLASEQAQARLSALTRNLVRAGAQELTTRLGSSETDALLVGLTRTITETAFAQAAESMQDELGPALQAVIRRDLAAGIADALQEPLRPALGQSAQDVAYHAVLGANRGLGTVWVGESGLAPEVRGLPAMVRPWLWGGLVLLGLLALTLASIAAMMIAGARRARAEVARLESASLLLATAMRERQAGGETDEIVSIVQQALQRDVERTGKRRLLGAVRLRKSRRTG